MTGNKIVPGQGAVSKNPPSEFTIEELADWLARLNPEFGYNRDKQNFRKIIEDSINTCDLAIGGSHQYPLPGRCVDCHRKYIAPQTIKTTDIEQWCLNRNIFFNTGKQKTQEMKEKEDIDGENKELKDELCRLRRNKAKLGNLIVAQTKCIKDLVKGKKHVGATGLIIKVNGRISYNALSKYLSNNYGGSKKSGREIKKLVDSKLLNI